MDKGTLFVVATPIGNLGDITLRAIETLKKVDFVIAEDTRVARKLLNHLGVSKPIERCDENVSENRISGIAEKLHNKTAALVTDAGTPNISDPGSRLISLAVNFGTKIVPIPGPSALTAALSIAHFPVNNFVFLGFAPVKKGRRTFFDSIAEEQRPVVLYESPHRILKTLTELMSRTPGREVMVLKELTKVFERVWRGEITNVLRDVEALSDTERKGEWIIVLS